MSSVKKLTIWSTEIEDQPGATSGIFRVLSDAGADLQFVLARRQPDKPGKGVLFVAPVAGKKQEDAARQAHLAPASNLAGVRVEGTNKKGLGYRLTQAIAEANLNLRALVATVIGSKYAAIFAFDSQADADRGLQALRKVK